jgi:hypothetical protein
LGLELALDLHAALREPAQLRPRETLDLAGVVAIRPPPHPQLGTEHALQMVLVDRSGGARPLIQGVGVDGHMAAVTLPADHVGDQAVGVDLRVAFT